MLALVIISIVFAVLAGFYTMHVPSTEKPLKKWNKFVEIALLGIGGVLSILWGISFVADFGWPDTIFMCAVNIVLMSVISMFLLAAGVAAVMFIFSIVLSFFCPKYYKEFCKKDMKGTPKNET